MITKLKHFVSAGLIPALLALFLLLPVFAEPQETGQETTDAESGTAVPGTETDSVTTAVETEPAFDADGTPILTRAQAAVVYNATDRRELYAKNADMKMYPAASAKLMTALLTAEYYGGNMDETVTVTSEMLAKVTGIDIGLRAGEQICVSDLYGAMVVGNANDAAQALAVLVAGSLSEFVNLMNARAAELGMTKTHYTNPTGMHNDNMVTTANDILLLAQAMYSQPAFMNLCARENYSVEATNLSTARRISNRNYLVSTNIVSRYYNSTVTGMNYGSTYEAGGCLVASSMNDGTIYLTVILGAQSVQVETRPAGETVNEDGTVTPTEAETETVLYAYVNANRLLSWAYKSFKYFRVVDMADVICELPVRLGRDTDYITLLPSKNVDLYLLAGTDVKNNVAITWELDRETLDAPVAAGTEIGTLTVSYNGEVVDTCRLVTRSTVDRSVFQYYYQALIEWTGTAAFRKGVGAFLILCVLYILAAAVFNQQKKKKALRRRLDRDKAEAAKKFGTHGRHE